MSARYTDCSVSTQGQLLGYDVIDTMRGSRLIRLGSDSLHRTREAAKEEAERLNLAYERAMTDG